MSDDWEGGRRQDVPWRRVVAVVVIAAALVGAWQWAGGNGDLPVHTDDNPVTGSTEAPGVVVTSPRRAGDRSVCRNDFPIRARDGVYYPVNFPRSRLSDRPQACFADRARAEAAGYGLAPAPEGAVLAGGVYVVPVEHAKSARCREVARAAGFDVPCPRRLPAPAFGADCTQGLCLFRDGVVIEQRGFAAPEHWCHTCPTRVAITATRPPSLLQLVTCRPGEAVPELPDRPITLEACPQGPQWIPRIGGHPHEGNLLYRWEREGVVYAASVDATAPVDDVRAVLRAVVEDIEFVSPPQLHRRPADGR